ncbi:MAG TPA: RnfABCDGE type electron transport complex subunit D [Phycisphaerae bacterium]|nr:RnfABCDGE type electron transport complex subunit D [Phycisphaerae bacterium]
MPEEPHILLPEPGALRWSEAPHWRAGAGVNRVTTVSLCAAGLVGMAGVVLFGWYAIRVLAISVAVALLIESLFHTLSQRSRRWSEGQALLIGLLTACTLPATAPWTQVATASGVAVLIGLILPGGVGNYLWHPVALGRVTVLLLFGQPNTETDWRVLAPTRLLTGDLGLARALPPLTTWSDAPLPSGIEAWQVVPAIDTLTASVPMVHGASPARALAEQIAGALPPFSDTLTGSAGGAIGEACVLAVILAGLLLGWQGLLRGRMILAATLAAVGLAAVLPVYFYQEGAGLSACWLPIRLIDDGLPVGLAWVAYQMTAGGLPLVLLVLAADPTSSPLTTRGQILFGILIAACAMLLRALTGIPCSAYWALLIANTAVPLINRMTRRRVFGTT